MSPFSTFSYFMFVLLTFLVYSTAYSTLTRRTRDQFDNISVTTTKLYYYE